MTSDLGPLFDGIPQAVTPPPAPIKTREEKIKAAFVAADERFKEEYRAFVLRVAEKSDDFTAEQCQLAYRDILGMPQPREWRSTGKIFRELMKSGLIVKVDNNGWSKMRSVPVPRYRKAGL